MFGCRGQQRASGTSSSTLEVWLLACWTHTARRLLEWPPIGPLAEFGVASLHSGWRGPAGKQLLPDSNVVVLPQGVLYTLPAHSSSQGPAVGVYLDCLASTWLLKPLVACCILLAWLNLVRPSCQCPAGLLGLQRHQRQD